MKSVRRGGGFRRLNPPYPLPIDLPADWVKRVNRPETSKELERLRTSVNRGRPFGGETWTRRTVARLGLPATLRGRGRPRKEEKDEAK